MKFWREMMGIVIDVDGHFEPGPDWLAPYPDLARRLPILDPFQLTVQAVCGDLLASMPPEERPSIAELSPPGLLELYAQEKLGEKKRRAEFEGLDQRQIADAKARVKWLDTQKIDIQNVICLSGLAYMSAIDDASLRREVIAANNDWLATTCAESGGRLLPVTTLEYSDLDWAIAELTRMRKRGSRTVLIPGTPINEVSIVHPSWDKFWNAVTENGMVAMLHTGFQRQSYERGWGNMAADPTLLRLFGASGTYATPMMLINAMVLSGLFERHPKLALVIAELMVGWMPFLLNEMDARTSPAAEMVVGKWKYPLKPSEYFARHVRGTPLATDKPLDVIMQQLPPDMIVFSSDFPHFEGYNDPMGHYAGLLDSLGADRRDLFLGESMAALYDRMGDPIRIRETA
jgi:predicted TIM-barrel fold metal-dependent hydrolase